MSGGAGKDMGRRGRIPRGPGWRLTGWIGGGGVALVAALLLAAPIASATTPVVTFTAPYSGMSKAIGNTLSSYGCSAAASEPVAPTFSTHTGIFRFVGRTSAGSCAASYSNYGEAYGTVALGGPHFQVPTNGSYKVGVIWKVTYAASLGVVLHKSTSSTTYSYAEAEVAVDAYMYVVDVTNGSYLYGTGVNYVAIASWLLSSTGTLAVTSGPASYLMTQWVKLAAGHTYAAEIYLYAYAYSGTFANAAFHDSAHANVNLGSGTDQALLAHIVVV